ncbi:organomercurial lyase [Dictyobacter halimunensis]|uniref:organomercurial lyase n=1 Tax=Dictyobacter halimunensis TaxID=3026934 RepID=UPI0030C69661
MNQSSLDLLALQLATHLDCTQDAACQHIMRAMVETGQPLSLMHLAERSQMSQEKLAAHLARVSDAEFDEQGDIVGWGITLLPTQHQFVLSELLLFTWCAFDTVLFPPLLQVEAHVQSECSATSQPITFVATPEGIADLLPVTSVLSLILPTERCECVRSTSVSNPCFSSRRRLPRLGWHCTPTRYFSRLRKRHVLDTWSPTCDHTNLRLHAAVGQTVTTSRCGRKNDLASTHFGVEGKTASLLIWDNAYSILCRIVASATVLVW